MNERIKELAEQAGFTQYDFWDQQKQFERFAELVRDDERAKCATDYLQDCCDAVDAARIEEREACAKLLENTDLTNAGQYIGVVSGIILGYVKAIRARSKHD